MKPPTAEELVGSAPYCLDREQTLRDFLGKTQDEIREMFRQNQHTSTLTEDMTYMEAAGLCYYLPAAFSYLQSEDSEGNWDFAHGLMCSLSSQVAIYNMRGEALKIIQKIAEYCDAHRSKFEFTPEDLFNSYLAVIERAKQ